MFYVLIFQRADIKSSFFVDKQALCVSEFENTQLKPIEVLEREVTGFVRCSYCLEDGKVLPNIKYQVLSYVNRANAIA